MNAGDGSAPESGQLRTIDLFGALSLAADLALGLSAGHGVRATYIGIHLARELRLPPEQLPDLFYADLLMDAGCTAWTSQLAVAVLGDEIPARRDLFFLTDTRDTAEMFRWLARYMAAGQQFGTRMQRVVNFAMNGKAFMMEGLRNTSDVAARMAGRLGTSPGVQQALRFVFENWDGSGPHAQRATEIPLISRIVYATIFFEVFHQLWGRETAVKVAMDRRGKSLDPDVVDAFAHLAGSDDFWRGLEDDSTLTRLREMEPESPYRYFRESQLDDAARAFADFADLKSFYSGGHSRRVAALMERLALAMDLPEEEVTTLRRAGLLHDIGLVAVPSFVLHKPESRLTDSEWETLRLHPYHAERILSRVPAFQTVIPLVAGHHERPDGRGYFRGAGPEQTPTGARLLAVAERFDELTHAGPERAALSSTAALEAMGREAGAGFYPEALAALSRSLDLPAPAAVPAAAIERKPEWPAGLTGREVEVLRILSTGVDRRTMAKRLSVSEHTIRHHLEHIYGKIDVSTRVAATLFAIEHGLLL